MTVLITLTVAGADSGPFNLYSNTDGFVSAFATGVSKSALLAGYSSALVPNYTTVIRVLSTGDCTNYIDIILDALTTTTTTSTTAGPTTTTTTTVAPTTTTTTTLTCYSYTLFAPGTSGEFRTADFIDCSGQPGQEIAYDYANVSFCASSITGGTGTVNNDGPCLL